MAGLLLSLNTFIMFLSWILEYNLNYLLFPLYNKAFLCTWKFPALFLLLYCLGSCKRPPIVGIKVLELMCSSFNQFHGICGQSICIATTVMLSLLFTVNFHWGSWVNLTIYECEDILYSLFSFFFLTNCWFIFCVILVVTKLWLIVILLFIDSQALDNTMMLVFHFFVKTIFPKNFISELF